MAREIEFKFLVDGEQALDAVKDAAKARGASAADPARQVNHFFDTPAGELRSRDAIVRLRDEDGRWILCAKGSPEVSEQAGGQPGELHKRTELERELPAPEAERILAGDADPLRRLEELLGAEPLLASLRETVGERELVPAGTLENRRTRVGPLAVHGTALYLELDRTSFPGGVTHHEVEFEVPEGLEAPAGELLRDLLAASGTEGRAAPSKSARFFRALAGEAI